MILDTLRVTYEQNREKRSLYVRNLLKQELQYYVLNYIFNSSYGERFLLKGGTCLRSCFDLPRLSEDLDFDVEGFDDFSFEQFEKDIEAYFKNKLQYQDFTIAISGKNKIIYIKFPVLRKIGFPVNPGKPSDDILFLRIDLAQVKGKSFKKELSLKSTVDFSFLIRRYGIGDIFAGKITALLTREKFAGKERMARFKGRDFFDIWWLKEKNIAVNKKYLLSLTGISSEQEIKKQVNAKIQEAAKRKSELKSDLLPFFENPQFVEDFVENLGSLRF